jgi:transcriptional regulator with XRE-family HTH domain
MTIGLGAELRRMREAAGLTQGAVALQLGVKRPTLSQWESDRHKPSQENLDRLDQLYNARGALTNLAAGVSGVSVRHLSIDDVFHAVADALVDRVVTDDDGSPLGWSHDLRDRAPTPFSTAFALRTLQMLDESRIDLHALAARVVEWRTVHWSNRSILAPRPQVVAVMLSTLARFGRIADLDGELAALERTLDEFAFSRPYIVCVALESVTTVRPDSPLVGRLVQALLDGRTRTGGGLLWTADASADPGLVEPSVAHTARAVTVLRMAQRINKRDDIAEAIGSATEWIADSDRDDNGLGETLRHDLGDRTSDVQVNHFTSAWVLRALIGSEAATAARLHKAVNAFWECYGQHEGLWVWRLDGSLPCWMTHDAIAALRELAFGTVLSPLAANP